jgi:pimeloyl-ACP methyl ester carboxylesterase
MRNKNQSTDTNILHPLFMDGIQGKMLYLPSKQKIYKHEILVVYGQDTNLEQWIKLAKSLSKYGPVTMPDLPGFGGMESFYKIKEKPSLDNLADYLAAFIKLRYKRRRIVIVGLSFGFVVATRMLQRYPELANRVDNIVSVAGLCHHDDIKISHKERSRLLAKSKFLSTGFGSFLYSMIYLEPHVFKYVYKRSDAFKLKFSKMDKAKYKKTIAQEIKTRRQNDKRTQMFVINEELKLDNCKSQVNVPVYNLVGLFDEYLDNQLVEQHMLVIFSDYKQILSKSTSQKYNFSFTEERTSFLNRLPDQVDKIFKTKIVKYNH